MVILLVMNWAVATPLLSYLLTSGFGGLGGGWGIAIPRANSDSGPDPSPVATDGRETIARDGICPNWAEVTGPLEAVDKLVWSSNKSRNI